MALTHWKSSDNLIDESWRRDLVPYWRSEWRSDPWWRDDFGLSPRPRNLWNSSWRYGDYELRTRETEWRRLDEIDFITTYNKNGIRDGIKVCIDVRDYKPHEITVRATSYSVIIEARHEEQQGKDRFVTRQFTRRYSLPFSYDGDRVTSEISPSGFLTVKAPLRKY